MVEIEEDLTLEAKVEVISSRLDGAESILVVLCLGLF